MVNRYGKEIFTPETVVFIDGETSRRDEEEPMKLNGRMIYTAEMMPARFIREIQVKLTEENTTTEQLTSLYKLCSANEGPTPVVYFLHLKDGNVAVLRNHEHGVQYTNNFWNDLVSVGGHKNVVAHIDRTPPPPPKRSFRKYSDD